MSKDARGDKSQSALVLLRNKGIIKRHFCSRIVRKVITNCLFFFFYAIECLFFISKTSVFDEWKFSTTFPKNNATKINFQIKKKIE